MVDISIVNGIINQLITGGHHLVASDMFDIQMIQMLYNISKGL